MKPLLFFLAVLANLTAGALGGTLRVPTEYRTIREAIAAAEPGDRIVVAPGTYQERVVLKPRLSLISEGEEAGLVRAERTVIDGGGGPEERPGLMMAEGAVVEGFTVTAVGRFDEPRWKQHWEERGQNQSHDEIGGFGVPAMAVDGVSCRIESCIVHHNGHTGIAVRGKPGAVIFPVITGNRCHHNMGGGIGLMEGAGGIVQGNECYENFFAGIGHSGKTAPLVMDNHCHHNIRAGIGISEGACPVVRGNRCHGNRRAGIGIRSGAGTRPVVEDNQCEENGMAGIGIEDGAEPILRGNRCVKNAMAGIGAEGGAKPLLVANECRDNGAAGIGLNTDCQGILWRNRCGGNASVAFGLPDGGRAIVVDNIFTREGGVPPLVAVRGRSEAVFVGNQLKGGGVAGLLVEGRAVVVRNRIEPSGGKPGKGIWLWKGSDALGVENGVTGYEKALTLSGDALWFGEEP